MNMLYDKLKPHIKAKMIENSKQYESVNWLLDKLKNTTNYSDLKVDDVRTIHTFTDIWYNDIPQLELMYGDWLINN